MSLLQVLLMSPPPAGAAAGNPVMNFLPIILIGVVFYFFMIRPQTKKMKNQKKFIEALKKGDKVVTSGGIYGKISELASDYFGIEIAHGVFIKVQRGAISLEASTALKTAEPK